MAWELEIHHIDLQRSGDSTILVARYNGVIQNTVLIDGGKTASDDIIHNYIVNVISPPRIDVIVATHYDKDHFAGIASLLQRQNTNLYDNAIIYDLGIPPNEDAYFRRKITIQTKRKISDQRKTSDQDFSTVIADNPDHETELQVHRAQPDTDYTKYIDAIAAKPTIRRATAFVNSFDIVRYDPNHLATIPYPANAFPIPNSQGFYLEPYWLLGKELMWGNGMDGLASRLAFHSQTPDAQNFPTMTCIAANKYILQNDGSVRYVSPLSIFDGPDDRLTNTQIAAQENKDDNAKSIGLLIQFNNFRYYVAGDLTEFQEDGCNNGYPNAGIFQPGVRARVNHADNMAGRVLAMKASHHGAYTSSSRVFINQLRPSAVIISCSEPNQGYSHPAPRTINVLGGYPESPILANKFGEHPPHIPPPPQRPVRNYLTGYQNPNKYPPTGYGDTVSETAGNPSAKPPAPGHIKLTVTEDQSRRSSEGQIYRGIKAAAQCTAQAVGIILTPLHIDTIADKGTVYGPATAVAIAIGAPEQAAIRALEHMACVGSVGQDNDDSDDSGILAAVLVALNRDENADAVTEVVNRLGNKISSLSNGVVQTIVAAMAGGDAITIETAATAAGATQNAGKAAGLVAETVRNTGVIEEDDTDIIGYAVAAAMGAIAGGATVAQGAAIAAAIVATVADTDAATTAQVTTKAAISAGMATNLAAIAGAVASVSYWEGIPNEVRRGVKEALDSANFGPPLSVTKAANTAQIESTIPFNDLFNLQFQYRGKNGVTKNGNWVHKY